MGLVVRDFEQRPFFAMKTLNGYAIYIKFGVKMWSDGMVSLIIGNHEMPFRKMPKWLQLMKPKLGNNTIKGTQVP